METNKLSIIIPVFNEEEVVNEILNEIYDSFKDVESYEIILVDDGSKNDISEFIDESLNKDNLIILRNDFNIGQTSSIKRGCENSEGNVIGIIDGDGQNPPFELKKLYDIYIENDFDAVVSFREIRKDNRYKKILSKTGNFILKFFTKSKFKDLGSSIKIINKQALESIKLDGELHRFIVPMLEKRNYKISEYPTSHQFRKYGKSNYGLNRLVPVFVDGILFYLSDGFTKTKRYAVGKLSLLLIILSALLNTLVIYQKVVNQIFVHRNPLFVLGMISLMLGIFIFSLGVFFNEKDEI